MKVSNSVFLHKTETGADSYLESVDSDLEECGIKVSNSVFLQGTDTGADSDLESVE